MNEIAATAVSAVTHPSTVTFWGTLPSWITAIVASGGFGALLTFILRNRTIGIKVRESDRQGYGNVIEKLNQSVNTLTQRVEAAETKASSAEAKYQGMTLRLGQNEFALRLMLGELERIDPGNDVLKQVRGLLAAAYPVVKPLETDTNFTAEIKKLDETQ
jgi:hypothetical protein